MTPKRKHIQKCLKKYFLHYHFPQATDLRKIYKHLKVMIAIGGWNEGSTKYSQMAADPAKRGKFVNSTVAFLQKYKGRLKHLKPSVSQD